MSSPKSANTLLWWLVPRLSLPLLVLNGWVLLLLLDYFKQPLVILVVGAVLAFLLGHPVRWLERRRVKPLPAISLMVLITLILIALLGVTLVPLLSQQAQDLVVSFPTWEQSANQQVLALHRWLQQRRIPFDLTGVAANLDGRLSQQLQAIAAQVPRWLEGAIGGIFEFFLIVVVTVYLLLRGQSLWDGLFAWLPDKLGRQLKIVLPHSFRNYFIGQGTIALILGITMAIAFTLVQIPYGFLFGVLIGMLAIFPYGATLGIALVAFLLALKSIGLGLTVLTIATLIDQVVENGIAPRLMGHLTGVHPVWVVMAILMGAKIAGLLGVVLAIPIASTVKEVAEIYQPKMGQG